MSTNNCSTIPEAFDFTSTLVTGSILPVATTDRATSARVALACRLGSMEVPVASLASATPATTTRTTTTTPSQIQNRLLFLAPATKTLQDGNETRAVLLRT